MVERMSGGHGLLTMAMTPPDWIPIPAGLPDAEAAGWVDRQAVYLRDAWGESWDEVAAVAVPEMLARSLAERPDEHLVLEAWPVFLPVRARILASVVESDAAPRAADGWTSVPIESEGLGPGVVLARVTALDDAPASLVDWIAVFDDGDAAMVMRVDSAPTGLFALVVPRAVAVLEGMQLTLPDGSSFRARPPLGVVTDPSADAAWGPLRMRESGLAALDGQASAG